MVSGVSCALGNPCGGNDYENEIQCFSCSRIYRHCETQYIASCIHVAVWLVEWVEHYSDYTNIDVYVCYGDRCELVSARKKLVHDLFSREAIKDYHSQLRLENI